MKKFLLVFGSVILVTVFAVFAYNSENGAPKQQDGISQWPQMKNDSLVKKGKLLIQKMKYNDQDLQAITLYLNNR